MANKPQVNYYSRDFASIKASLVDYAKRFYPNEYNDFTQASFGSFLLDAMSYIGDTLSFQLDYQANENLLSTAINRGNILQLAKQMGWTESASPTVTGFVTVYVKVPAKPGNIGPDTDYLPVLKKNTLFTTNEGAVYSLGQDVDFSDESTEFVVSDVSESTGAPTHYAARQKAKVISGVIRTTSITVPERATAVDFYKTTLTDTNIVEIVSVMDLEGNTYYQVEALTQNLVYKAVLNENKTASKTVNIMQPYVAARRFVTSFEDGTTTLTFGNGKEDSTSTLDTINDPTKVVLQKFAKDYVSTTMLDPTVINDNDKFGIGPSNTQLTVIYRSNTSDLISAGRNQIKNVSSPVFVFPLAATDDLKKAATGGSIEVENDEPIAAARTTLTNDELREVALGVHYAQNRAVTIRDYESMTYRMPSQFGVIKRVRGTRDYFSPRRAINLYVLGQNNAGGLATTTTAVKTNVKTWLDKYKSISDSMDILDGRIVNFQIKYTLISNQAFPAIDANIAANLALRDYFNRRKYNFGESINISEILKRMNDLEQVDDVIKVSFKDMVGAAYSTVHYDFDANTTADGRYIKIPEDHIFEIKFYDETIIGEAV